VAELTIQAESWLTRARMFFDGIRLVMSCGFASAVNASAGRPHKPGVEIPESVVVAAEYPEDFVAVFTINYAVQDA